MFILKSYDELEAFASRKDENCLYFDKDDNYGAARFSDSMKVYCEEICEILTEKEANMAFGGIESIIHEKYENNIFIAKIHNFPIGWWIRGDWLKEINDKAFDVDIEELI